jgi:hypothetical protein
VAGGATGPVEPERADVDADQLLAEWGEVLAGAETVTACDQLELEHLGKVPESLKPQVSALIGKRRDAIRGGRGERSNGNGGKPSQPATDPLEWTKQQAAKCSLFADWKKLDGQINAADWSDETKAAARGIVEDGKKSRRSK